MARKILLGCGGVSPMPRVMPGVATIMRYSKYTFTEQVNSELTDKGTRMRTF